MVENQVAKAKPQGKPQAKNLPKFVRQNVPRKKRVGDAWRKPRGIDNKQRVQKSGFGSLPRIGYRTAKSERGLHPNGLREVLVRTMRDLSGLKGVAVRFSATLGGKQKALLVAEAKKMQLRILNE